MPRISNTKKEKIIEQALSYLYQIFPKSAFTAHIAQEIARDEEFMKLLMHETEKKGIVVPIKKNPQGKQFTRRIRWRLTNKAYQAYKQRQ
ncbi:hypothetical protein JXA48_05270 [Candidatus Woesearchaeota archaeon]|nr:hypothetical protein [Candidatus Woesearchaeota archaeon]